MDVLGIKRYCPGEPIPNPPVCPDRVVKTLFFRTHEVLHIPPSKRISGIFFQKTGARAFSSQLVAFVLNKRREREYRVRFIPTHEINNYSGTKKLEDALDRHSNEKEHLNFRTLWHSALFLFMLYSSMVAQFEKLMDLRSRQRLKGATSTTC